jgi:hypothetical protein
VTKVSAKAAATISAVSQLILLLKVIENPPLMTG